jgi:hypothetical protein
MSATLQIRDESASGQTLHQWSLEFLTERITVRELIRGRVYQEVQDYNRDRPGTFRGLVRPAATGADLARGRVVDWKEQFEKAVDGFEKNRLLILVGDRQAESLDQEIELNPGTEATFIQLVPLVGG